MGSCAAKPVKRTAASMKPTVPLLTNPSNYTVKLIQPSLFYNLVTKDFNRESAGQPKMDCEYIDFRDQASYQASHLKAAMNIDSNLIHEGKEEIYRSLKVILDFKKLVIMGEDLVLNGNEISEDLAEFIRHLEAAKISITMIYVLDASISKLLKRFPFFSHDRDSHFDSKHFPLLLYTQNDKVPLIKSQLSLPKQADMKYKVPETEQPTQLLLDTTVYIQEYTRFSQSFDEKVYIDVLGVKNILIVTNSSDDATKTGSPQEKKFESFHIPKEKRPVVYQGNLNNKRAVSQTLMKLFKQQVPFIIVHGKKHAETTLSSFVEFLEANQRLKGSSVRIYIEERIPKLKLAPTLPQSDVQIDQKKMSRVLDNQTDEKAIKSRLEEINDCMISLKKACKGNMDEVNAVYNLLSRIIDNIMKSPEEEKYRALNQNNAKLKETIFKYDASKRLVELVGFYKKEDGGSSQYYNPLDAKTMKHIKVDVDIGYKNVQTTEVV